jgi:hypothetical protein
MTAEELAASVDVLRRVTAMQGDGGLSWASVAGSDLIPSKPLSRAASTLAQMLEMSPMAIVIAVSCCVRG